MVRLAVCGYEQRREMMELATRDKNWNHAEHDMELWQRAFPPGCFIAALDDGSPMHS